MNELLIPDTRIIQFGIQDIPGLIELSESVGWDYDENEIRTIMSSGKVFGHKNIQGKIISSAAIIYYDSKLSTIGMIIVSQEYRGLGLGRKATEKCLNSLAENTIHILIATDEGKPMYEKMGFNSTDHVNKYLCDSDSYILVKPDSDFKTVSICDNDINSIINLDKEAFGVKRKNFLINRINQANEALVVKDNKGTIIGFGLSILGPVNLLLGPIIAPTPEIACLIIHNLTKKQHFRFRIDVPSRNDVFMSYLEKCGFVKINQPPIMIKNSDSLPKRNNTLYGIASQCFG